MNIFDVMEENGIGDSIEEYSDETLLKNFADIEDFTDEEKLITEKETTGIYLSGHPLNKYIDFIKSKSNVKSVDLVLVIEEDVLGRGHKHTKIWLFSPSYFCQSKFKSVSGAHPSNRTSNNICMRLLILLLLERGSHQD